jgi:hypothetical protein
MRVPDKSMLPGSQKAPPVVVALLKGARATIESNPLASVAAALALGAVIVRLTR